MIDQLMKCRQRLNSPLSSMIHLHPLACLIICTALCKLFFLLCSVHSAGWRSLCVYKCVCVHACLGRLQGNLLFTLSAGETLFDASQVVLCNIDVLYIMKAWQRRVCWSTIWQALMRKSLGTSSCYYYAASTKPTHTVRYLVHFL